MARKSYSTQESTLYFMPPAVGSGDQYISFTPLSLPNGSGWKSDPVDLGSFPRSSLFRWRAKAATLDGSQNNGGSVDYYWSSFDDPDELGNPSGLYFGADSNLTSGDSIWTFNNPEKNAKYIGAVEVYLYEDASGYFGTTEVFTNSGFTEIFGRYGMLLCLNRTGASLSEYDTKAGFSLTYQPDEIQ